MVGFWCCCQNVIVDPPDPKPWVNNRVAAEEISDFGSCSTLTTGVVPGLAAFERREFAVQNTQSPGRIGHALFRRLNMLMSFPNRGIVATQVVLRIRAIVEAGTLPLTDLEVGIANGPFTDFPACPGGETLPLDWSTDVSTAGVANDVNVDITVPYNAAIAATNECEWSLLTVRSRHDPGDLRRSVVEVTTDTGDPSPELDIFWAHFCPRTNQ